ncbi:uncharacterized protein Z518_03728 [Rhinocladiella mackenziei CBS 650.93]|uniref:Uncharacterized protein n=1 Tax=Rhinocladiella mackenziei CBS 650.93 TaxID=1442369 RepID=A0A0D2IRG6_9EURO|nr:uncharacterized protein Z518_03728 [Rhinocladiella mackenziei CBS 650.93]KIX05756.1 hypothetical protein Z518_03728 [Rhinocladiella mackenziei CBS 650.93]
MDKQKKTSHALSLPYPDPQWPAVSADREQAILQLLIPLLEPIGDFRRGHVPRSKGKGRARGGKKANTKAKDDSTPESMPEVYDHLTIGFNSTVRRLESLARSRKPPILSRTKDLPQQETPSVNLSVVFVCRQSLPEIMSFSLPLLLATSAPRCERARLVEISPPAEAKIAQTLEQPRVRVLGLEAGASGADALRRFLTDNIGVVDVPWLDPESPPAYFPVNIQTIETEAKPKSAARNLKRKKSGDN